MKLSIVTISFNQAKFLERAIRSVLDQGHPELEYIVVDAGSTDGSKNIIDKYRHRLSHVIQEPDKGPADGLNKGFRHATGDIFGYLNADDEYLSGSFAEVADIFSRSPSTSVICGGGFIVDAEGRQIRRVDSDPFSRRRYLYGAVTILQQSTFFRREAFAVAGGFNKVNKTSWDGELILSFARRGMKFKTIHRPWSTFRIHDSSISGTGRMNDQYLLDLDRFFVEEYGRSMNRYDRLLASLMRLEKWLINPIALYHRIIDLSSAIRKRWAQ